MGEGEGNGIRTAIIIAKEGKGSMTIDALADGAPRPRSHIHHLTSLIRRAETGFAIDNVSFYSDPALALDTSSEADWKRRSLYIGPTFENLDEELQGSFEEFLAERGINSGLAQM